MAALTFAQQFLNNLFEGILTGRLAEHVTIQEVRRLLAKVKRIFRKQPMMLQINAPVVICGDLHGQFNDVIRMFSHEGFPNARSYLFLGDYIDRGNQSVELILFMFACKIRYPRNFYMLRGNHETASINNVYGFRQALMDVYASAELYHAFQGGLSPVLYDAPNIVVLNTIQRPLTDAQITTENNQLATDLLCSRRLTTVECTTMPAG